MSTCGIGVGAVFQDDPRSLFSLPDLGAGVDNVLLESGTDDLLLETNDGVLVLEV